jgi:hypothetical protein
MASVDIFATIFSLVEGFQGAFLNPEVDICAGYLYCEGILDHVI